MLSRRSQPVGSGRADGLAVTIAWASHGAEAEMWAGLLEDHGIPALVQRAPGADVPDFLVSGPRIVRVRPEHADRAREILHVVEDDASDEAQADDGAGLVLGRSPLIVVAAAVIATLLLISALLGAVEFLPFL